VPDVELESARLVAQALRIPAATLGAAFVVLEPA
jgi:hypothetical protein